MPKEFRKRVANICLDYYTFAQFENMLSHMRKREREKMLRALWEEYHRRCANGGKASASG